MATIRKKSELSKYLDEFNIKFSKQIKESALDDNSMTLSFNSNMIKPFLQVASNFSWVQLNLEEYHYGFLISDPSFNYALFIEFNKTQELILYKLYKDDLRFEKINEYCDINELRRCVNEYDVTKDDFEALVKEVPTGLKMDDDKLYLTHDGKIISGQTNPVEFKTIFGNQPLHGSGNIDLYRHQLSFEINNGQFNLCAIIYSSNNLKINSLQDLTAVTKATYGYGMQTIGISKSASTVPNCIIYTGSVWKAGQGNCNVESGDWLLDVNSDTYNVTAVNDRVETL